MPTMANITVLDSASANVVYNVATPSAGDRSPAVWRQNAAHVNIGFRPKFTLVTRDNQKANGRIFAATFSFPCVVAISGVDTVVATVPMSISGTLPTNVDSSFAEDAFVQFGNLLVSTLIRSAAAEGYAPG